MVLRPDDVRVTYPWGMALACDIRWRKSYLSLRDAPVISDDVSYLPLRKDPVISDNVSYLPLRNAPMISDDVWVTYPWGMPQWHQMAWHTVYVYCPCEKWKETYYWSLHHGISYHIKIEIMSLSIVSVHEYYVTE
jgi:hypothetical protein